MDRHSVTAFITGLLLVPLAWVGIAQAVRLHEGPAALSGMLIWGALFVVDLVIAVYSVLHLRRARAQRPRQ
jgi:hypothetical protein